MIVKSVCVQEPSSEQLGYLVDMFMESERLVYNDAKRYSCSSNFDAEILNKVLFHAVCMCVCMCEG